MRFQRLLTLLLGVALLGAPALVVAGAAPSHAGIATWQSRVVVLGAGPARQVYGAGYQVRVQIQGLEPESQQWLAIDDPSQQVTLQRRLAGQSSWAPIATQNVDGNGVTTFSTKVAANASYRVYYAGGTYSGGSPAFTPSTSKVVTVKALRSLGAKSSKLNRNTFRFYGKVAPKFRGKVTLQRNTGSGWKTVGSTRTSATSAWSFRVQGKPSRGKWRYRAFIASNKQFQKSYSAVLTITTT